MRVPPIDVRDVLALIRQMQEMTPFYTPEWRFTPEDPDPGTALFLLFARMLGDNISRLNQVPHKNFVAFLNMLDVSQQSSLPAKSYLTFYLSEGAQETVAVPKGTKVAGTPPEGGEPIIFETAHSVMVTPARLTDMYNVSVRHDRIVRLDSPSGEEKPAALFRFGTEGDVQEHSLLLKHDHLFRLKHGARIELEMTHSLKRFKEAALSERLADNGAVTWSYFSGGAWVPFDEAESRGNRLILTKRKLAPWEETELQEGAGRWLRCKVRSLGAASGTPDLAELELDGLRIKADYADLHGDGGIAPERMYFGDIQIDSGGGYPFGDLFAPFGTFYAACEEPLSKRGGKITVSFRLSRREHRLIPEKPPHIDWKPIMKKKDVDKVDIPDQVSITRVVWEYWNGSAWVRLPVPAAAETLFYHPVVGHAEFAFVCPADLEQTFVNSEWNYWIRARILHIEHLYSANPLYLSPWIEQVRLKYAYDEPLYPPEACWTRNNAESRDCSGQTGGSGRPFAPFRLPEGGKPAVYFGFDRAPIRGPISLYFSVLMQKAASGDIPLIEWEYGAGEGSWRPLKTTDGTNGFTQSGTVLFYSPADLAELRMWGRDRYWIRAVNKDARFDSDSPPSPCPLILGVHLNTVAAIQQETVEQETPQTAAAGDFPDEASAVVLARTPVVSEEVWVDETGHLAKEELAELELAEGRTDIVRDSEGQVLKCWARYEPVANFLASGPSDRHYRIDRSTGRIYFGDGIHGKRLPNSDIERIKVNYKTGGGERGNLDRLAINQLQTSIAFIQSVVNHEPASGGCEPESLQEALKRGPQLVKHRGRAVTAEDYEWLAREAYPGIGKVKCLPGRNARMEKERGCVTLVVLPKMGFHDGPPFIEMKKRVENYLRERAAYPTAFPGSIQVIGPAWLEIGVQAVLAVKSMEEAAAAESQALSKIGRFLHPLYGGLNGNGWEIGKPLHLSMFYALLKSIGSIHHVDRLTMTVTKLEDGVRTELLPENMSLIPHGIVTEGIHKLAIEIV
ncbi:hypothetical protein AV654_02925 [Paenibacillus elgii]|uniref:Uncharacterized protein n=1 Tax=Paenibacillus elgii TaxID=189691 RepID=A0A163WQ21_9BACL|nr:hypothetical protein AV654_02925 [Paenibacillus elgii]